MKRWIAVALCSLLWGGSAFAAPVPRPPGYIPPHFPAQTCVRTIAASTPTSDFVDNSNGTVTHTKTGLMWKQCPEGLLFSSRPVAGCVSIHSTAFRSTWQGALQHVQALNQAGGFAGFTDWRVPNIKELASIIETRCVNPAVNATIFPGTAINAIGSARQVISNWYWSASPVSYSPTEAWLLDFSTGSNKRTNKKGKLNHYTPTSRGGFYVRLVRGGH